MVISYSTCQMEEKECIWVIYFIYGVLSRFQICRNLHVFPPNLYSQNFRVPQKMIFSKSVCHLTKWQSQSMEGLLSIGLPRLVFESFAYEFDFQLFLKLHLYLNSSVIYCTVFDVNIRHILFFKPVQKYTRLQRQVQIHYSHRPLKQYHILKTAMVFSDALSKFPVFGTYHILNTNILVSFAPSCQLQALRFHMVETTCCVAFTAGIQSIQDQSNSQYWVAFAQRLCSL